MPLRRTFGVDELDALVQKHRISDVSADNSDDEDVRIEKEFQARMDKLNIKAAEQTARLKACQEKLRFYQSTPDQHIPEKSSKLSSDMKLHK